VTFKAQGFKSRDEALGLVAAYHCGSTYLV